MKQISGCQELAVGGRYEPRGITWYFEVMGVITY